MARSTFLQAVIQELTEAKSKEMSVNNQNTKGNNTTDTTCYIDTTGVAPKVSNTLHKGKVGKKIAKETIKKIFDNMQIALKDKMALYEMAGNQAGVHRTRQQLMEFHGMRRSMEDNDRMSNMRFQIPDELKGRVRDSGESRSEYDDDQQGYDDYDDYNDYNDYNDYDDLGTEQEFSKSNARDANDLDQDGVDDDMETQDHDNTEIVQGNSDQEVSVDSSTDYDVDAPEEDIDIGTVINNVLEKLRNDHTLTVRDAFLSVLNADAGGDSDVTMSFGDDLPNQPQNSDVEQLTNDEDQDFDDSLSDDEPQMDAEYSSNGEFDDYSQDEDDLDYRDDSYNPRANQLSNVENSDDEYQDDMGFDENDYEQHDANFPPTRRRRTFESSVGSKNYAVGFKNGTVTSREQTAYIKADDSNQAVRKIAKMLKESGVVAYSMNVRDASKSEIAELFEAEQETSSFDCNGCSVQKLRDVNHAQMICKGTSWNICNSSTFDRANDEGPLYVVIKQGKPMFLLQPATQKFVDVRNKDIDTGLAQKLLNLR